jgi:hypothetical protein
MAQLPFHSSSLTPRQIFGDIPILYKFVEIYKTWHQELQNLPRLSRYTLGEKIDSLFCDLLELILEAGYAAKDNKKSVIDRASIKLDALKFFLQLIWEIKLINTKKYTQLAEPLIETGKMLGGWRKQLLKNNPLE